MKKTKKKKMLHVTYKNMKKLLEREREREREREMYAFSQQIYKHILNTKSHLNYSRVNHMEAFLYRKKIPWEIDQI